MHNMPKANLGTHVSLPLQPWSEFSFRWHKSTWEQWYISHKTFKRFFSLVIDLFGTLWSPFKECNQVIQQFPLQKDQPWLLNNSVMMTNWPCFGLNRHSGCWNPNRMWREMNLCSLLAMADFLLGGLLVDKPLGWVTLKHIQLHILLCSLVAFHLFANLKHYKKCNKFHVKPIAVVGWLLL